MQRLTQLLLIIGTVVVLSGCTNQQQTINDINPMTDQTNAQQEINSSSQPISASLLTIKTNKGDIIIELLPEAAPNTVQNYLQKADSKYYQGLSFHRVEDWVIQGGDPLGNGTGGGKMPTELSNVPFVAGSVGVARGGDINVSNDSQFFICTTDCDWLTGQYTIFGQVKEGMDVVTAIEIGDTIVDVTYQ